MALAAGLLIGGQRPIVVAQCTGLFEAGDSLRNVIHDMKLPLFLVVGVRSFFAHQRRATSDSCPVFAEPILRAWQIPYRLLDKDATAADLVAVYSQAQKEQRAGAVLFPE
jgi:sulfopyruvate decarboxylase TPP-binding subunit